MSADKDNASKADGVDFAWHVHDALDSWTAKVDTKASISLAIEIAVLGFVINLSAKGGRLAQLSHADVTYYRLGLAFLVASILLSVLVVIPQLSRKSARQDWKSNMIYFGHLRHWDPKKLTAALLAGPPAEEQLARQLVNMSKVNWRKHAWLQWSLVSLCVAAAWLLAAGH